MPRSDEPRNAGDYHLNRHSLKNVMAGQVGGTVLRFAKHRKELVIRHLENQNPYVRTG